MYNIELAGLLRIATGSSRYDYSRAEMQEISETIDAIQHLEERMKTLDMKQRVTMPTHGSRKRVWHVASAEVRGKQIYIDRRTVYTQMACGALAPIKPRALGGLINIDGISAEELSFVARFI